MPVRHSAVAACVLSVLSLVAVSCGSSGGESGRPSQAESSVAVVETEGSGRVEASVVGPSSTVVTAREVVEVEPGGRYEVATAAGTRLLFDGAFDVAQQLRVGDGPVDGATAPFATLIGTPVVVELEVEPVVPVRVSFETDAPAEGPPIVGSWSAGQWEVLPATHDLEAGTTTAEVSHFGSWAPWQWCWSCIADDAAQAIGQMLGNRAGAPGCPDGQPDWLKSSYGDAASSAVLVGCTTDNDGLLEVRLVNNRSYGLIVTSPISFQYVALDAPLPLNDLARDAVGDSWFSHLSANLFGAEDSATTQDWLYLPPTTEAFIGIAQPETTQFALTGQRTLETVILDVTAALFDVVLDENAADSFTEAIWLLMAECQLIPWATTNPPTDIFEFGDWLRLLGECASDAVVESALTTGRGLTPSQFAQIKSLDTILRGLDVLDGASKLADNFVDSLVAGLPRFTIVVSPLRSANCSESTISADVGTSLNVIEGLCVDGWAYVETGAAGDAQSIVRIVDGRWETYTAFPSFRCRSEAIGAGAPIVIVDRVGWMCEGAALASWDGTYTNEPASGALRIGHNGSRVHELQSTLVNTYSLLGGDDVDGYFGERTAVAVEIFQGLRSLQVDGVAGPATLAALGLSAGEPGNETSTQPGECLTDTEALRLIQEAGVYEGTTRAAVEYCMGTLAAGGGYSGPDDGYWAAWIYSEGQWRLLIATASGRTFCASVRGIDPDITFGC